MAANEHNVIIDIDGLTKQYPGSLEWALRGVQLQIYQGEFFGMLGPNGSGKTTIISISCGLLAPTQGKIVIGGHILSRQRLGRIKQKIGLVPQEIAIYPKLTFRENLRFFGKLYGLYGKKLKENIDHCIEIAGLQKYADWLVGKYSGGMKRRANIAIGLIHAPSILFLDEPTVNVDPQSREVIFAILNKLNDELGTTIIYTTHYLEEAQQLCDRVAILDRGVVIKAGTPEELIANTPDCKSLGEVFLHLTGRELRD